MVDDKNFGGKVGIVGSGKSIYVLSLFLMNIGLARSMGSGQFGSFQQVFILTAVFMILCMGIPETLYFFLPRLNSEERSGFLGQTLILLVFSGTAAALVLWFGAEKIAEIQDNPHIVSSLRLFGIYGAFLIVSSIGDPIFITFKRLKYLFILSSLHGLFFIVLTLFQIFADISMVMMFSSMAVFGLCKCILSLVFLYRMRSEIGTFSFFGAKYNVLLQLSYSLPIALSTSVEMISRWLDKFVISVYFGPEQLGFFYVGAIEIPLVWVLLSSVYSVASPVLNNLYRTNNTEGFTSFINKTLKFTGKLIWPLFVYLMFFADHLIPLIFKADYMASVAPFRVYLMMLPVRIALYGVILIALGRPRVVFWSAFSAMILNLVLNLVLVEHIGFLGPAIATVISTYFHVVVLIAIIMKTLQVRFRDLVPVRAMIDIGLACFISAMVAFFLTRYLVKDLSVIIFSLSIFIGAYIFLGSKAGFFRILSLIDLAKGDFFGKNVDRKED